jgi:hypothetical protein
VEVIVIGIDIGLTGAVCAVDSRGTAVVHDMPTRPDGKPRKTVRKVKGVETAGTKQPMRIDGRALRELLLEIVPPGASARVVFEDVRPRSGGNGTSEASNSMHSQGSMMRSRGIVEAVVDIARIEAHVVQPQTWKRHFGLLGTKKDASMATARGLFPSEASALKRVKDHNRAEALLIARFGQDTLA